jgi:hypothetical protein
LFKKNKKKNDIDNLNLSICKNSFEISPFKKPLKNISQSNTHLDHINSINVNINKDINKEMKIKKLKTKRSIINKNKIFNIENKNSNFKRRRVNSCVGIPKENKKNESDYSSSDDSLSLSHFSSDIESNDNDNIFICKSPAKVNRNSLKSTNNSSKCLKINKSIIIKIGAKYDNLNIITNGKYGKSQKLQNYIKRILEQKITKYRPKPKPKETPNRQKIKNSASVKLVKHKTMAKKFPEKFTKNNLYKVTLAHSKLKKTEVKSLFKKPMISEIRDGSTIMDRHNRSPLKESKLSYNSMTKKERLKKKNDEFLLDYVNKNIRDDNAVLNNPGQFYNGLFSNIMKNATVKKIMKTTKTVKNK